MDKSASQVRGFIRKGDLVHALWKGGQYFAARVEEVVVYSREGKGEGDINVNVLFLVDGKPGLKATSAPSKMCSNCYLGTFNC